MGCDADALVDRVCEREIVSVEVKDVESESVLVCSPVLVSVIDTSLSENERDNDDVPVMLRQSPVPVSVDVSVSLTEPTAE